MRRPHLKCAALFYPDDAVSSSPTFGVPPLVTRCCLFWRTKSPRRSCRVESNKIKIVNKNIQINMIRAEEVYLPVPSTFRAFPFPEFHVFRQLIEDENGSAPPTA